MTADQRPRAGRREWIGLGVIALPCLVYAMDLTVLNLAVPAISAELQPSGVQLLWIVDVYGFMVAGLLIPMGTLGDRIGRRRLLLIGAGAFAVASVLAARARSPEELIAARALLGVAGATLAPSTLSLIRVMFKDSRQRTVAVGVWIASFSLGAAIGPLVGGVLLERYWWGSVFLPAVPVMALVIALGPRLLPEFRDPEAGRLDLVSATLSLAAVLAVIYGLKQIAQDGPGSASVVAVVGGIGLGAAFLRRQGRLADPLIDLRLFAAPAFGSALVVYTVGFFVNFGALLLVAQYLQLVLGLSPLQAGAWTVPGALGFVLGGMLTPAIRRRVAPGATVAGGLALAALGFVVLGRLDAASGVALLVVGSVVLSLGLAAVFTLATDVMVSAAPAEQAGAASAIAETGAELGGALGIAILGTIASAVYQSHVVTAVPEGLDPAAAKAAGDTLGGAVAIGGQLPPSRAADLLDGAREAFVDGLHLATTVSAAVLLAACGLAVVALRRSGAAPADRPREVAVLAPCPLLERGPAASRPAQ